MTVRTALAGFGRVLQLADVFTPVTGQQLQTLTSRHGFPRRPLKAGSVEVGRVAHGAHQPSMGLPDLGQELIEALVLVQAAADLVHGIGVPGDGPQGPPIAADWMPHAVASWK